MYLYFAVIKWSRELWYIEVGNYELCFTSLVNSSRGGFVLVPDDSGIWGKLIKSGIKFYKLLPWHDDGPFVLYAVVDAWSPGI